jgi:PelA/Pel-15E family pectate lyase
MKHLVALLALCLATRELSAATVKDAEAAMAKATAFMQSIAAEGGYLWKYSEDLKTRAGEGKATETQIWIQPPGTPSMGMVFLRAHEATKDKLYLNAARGVAHALARGQLESGGWEYSVDFDPKKFPLCYRRTGKGKLTPAEAAKRRNITTFDDDNTQSALRFLMAYVAAQNNDTEARAAVEYGLAKMIEAQYPNGAWPQRYDGKPRNPSDFPVKRAEYPKDYPRIYPKINYAGHYTFNDNTIHDCIGVMLDAYHRYGKAEHLASAKKAGDFMILAQMPEPQPVWAQQYNANMEPAWARAFEPPAITGNESVGVIRGLIELYLETGDEKYLKPIPPALAWYKRSAIAPNTWARYYELQTNKPIYGDRDGKIYYRVEDISEERQHGYSWKGTYSVEAARSLYERVTSQGREAFLKSREPKKRKSSGRRSTDPRVDKIIAALDAQGRWLTEGKFEKKVKGLEFDTRIETTVFIANMRTLSDYVEACR